MHALRTHRNTQATSL